MSVSAVLCAWPHMGGGVSAAVECLMPDGMPPLHLPSWPCSYWSWVWELRVGAWPAFPLSFPLFFRGSGYDGYNLHVAVTLAADQNLAEGQVADLSLGVFPLSTMAGQ